MTAPHAAIWHNPACGTSRNVLALLRHVGVEPRVRLYLDDPPGREELRDAIARAGLTARAALRVKGTPHDALGLGDPSLPDDALLDAMLAHPVLINRPFVFTPLGVRLCRPSEVVLNLLPPDAAASAGAFAKEDGAPVLDADGRRVA